MTPGPVDFRPPRGVRYVVVQSWEYTRDGTSVHGSARDPEFVL